MSGRIIRLPKFGAKEKEDPRPLVKICVPYYDSICPRMQELLEQVIISGIPGYRAAVWHNEGTLIHFSRNEAVSDTPQLEWDFIFFLDDDIGFNQEDARRMVKVHWNGKEFIVPIMIAMMKKILDNDFDVCGGLYTQRGAPYLPLAFKKVYLESSEGPWLHILTPPDKGVFEVDAVATGFLCIKRRVIDAFVKEKARRTAVKESFNKWTSLSDEYMKTLPSELVEYLKICKADIANPFWFDHIYDPTMDKWVDVGEDIRFCREAQKLGFKIFCDFGVQVGHLVKRYQTPAQYKHAFMDTQVQGHIDWAKERGIVSTVLGFGGEAIPVKKEEAESG